MRAWRIYSRAHMLTIADLTSAKSSGEPVWIAILAMVKAVSEVLLTSLPNFWRIAKAHMDGKYRRAGTSSSRRSPTQVRTMALDIVRLHISLVSEFFVFTDMAVRSPGFSADNTPANMPDASNSLTTAHFLVRALGELLESVNEVNALEISSEVSASLKAFVESARWRFEDVLTMAWLRGSSFSYSYLSGPQPELFIPDAKLFHHLESWVASSTEDYTTAYLGDIMVFQKQQTTTAFKLAGGVDISASASKLGKQYPVANEFVTKINKAFLDSLYSMLEGLEHLASDPALGFEQAAPVAGIASAGDAAPQTASASANLLEMLDITDSVRISYFTRVLPLILSHLGKSHAHSHLERWSSQARADPSHVCPARSGIQRQLRARSPDTHSTRDRA